LSQERRLKNVSIRRPERSEAPGGGGGGGGGGARFARGLVKLVMPACHHVATDLAETPAKESSTYSFYVVRIAIAMTMT
jgi:hypothetical protein